MFALNLLLEIREIDVWLLMITREDFLENLKTLAVE